MNDKTEQDRATPSDESRDWFECDDGWGPLITELEDKLKALSPDYTVSQVKEEFGGLRYYASPGDVDEETSEQFYGLIREAEAKSYEICERCGQPGRLSRRGKAGWYKTLCTACSGELNFEPVRDDEGSAPG
ncbi:hypothetical protein [Nocardioides bigeumensis]|uniref:DksA C4-type domain-containing protein n=1 Tax=Nocardioides bigeumensis TaxID=433657 RepID=A0ABP5K1G4_9ACTN